MVAAQEIKVKYGFGSALYWFLYYTVDPNLKYTLNKFWLINNTIGLAEGAD